MKALSNELLIFSYNKAIELKLEEEFILMLEEEILRRNISTKNNNVS
ncbi:sporulation histidine kinase inhibitor Sda [Bacillaceae bacterium S4-13-58]